MASPHHPLCAAQNLRLQKDGVPVLSLNHFHLHDGEHTLLLGPSGCGKTTFLHLLAGLITPSDGSITIQGKPFSALPAAARDTIRGQNIGMVFQQNHLLGHLSVRDNLRLSAILCGRFPDDRHLDAHILSLLQTCKLDHLIQRKASTLSQGEAQRISIIRAVVTSPHLILADEPTSALDDENTSLLITFLFKMATAHHATLLVATHDSRIMPHFNHVVHMKDGALL